MDIEADLEELSALHKELENHPDAGGNAEEMKKAKIGLINVKAHLNQVDVEKFASILQNTFLFKVCVLIILDILGKPPLLKIFSFSKCLKILQFISSGWI